MHQNIRWISIKLLEAGPVLCTFMQYLITSCSRLEAASNVMSKDRPPIAGLSVLCHLSLNAEGFFCIKFNAVSEASSNFLSVEYGRFLVLRPRYNHIPTALSVD